MPRNGIDPCILCGEIKCRCGRRPKPHGPRKNKTAQPQAALPTQPAAEPHNCSWCTAEERAAGMPCACQPAIEASSNPDPWDDAPAPKEAARAAMKARAARSRAAQPARAVTHDATEDAIRALAPILHPDELHKFRTLINRHSDVTIRAATWRQRRSNA